MRRKIPLPVAAWYLVLTAVLSGAAAWADPESASGRTWARQDDPHHVGPPPAETIRVNLFLPRHRVETLKLGRLIRRQSHLNPADYRLRAVVVINGPHSHGYATLRTGKHRTARYFLPGNRRVVIPAPSRSGDRWRLRLGPGTQVRSVIAVLEPLRRVDYHHRNHRENGYARLRAPGLATPGAVAAVTASDLPVHPLPVGRSHQAPLDLAAGQPRQVLHEIHGSRALEPRQVGPAVGHDFPGQILGG